MVWCGGGGGFGGRGVGDWSPEAGLPRGDKPASRSDSVSFSSQKEAFFIVCCLFSLKLQQVLFHP
jgi:hypothetical protein